MKGLVLTLAVVFLSGTQGVHFPWQQDEPQTPVEQAREVIMNYMSKVHEIGKEAVSQLETSEIGKQLDLKIAEKFDVVGTNAMNLKKQLHPYIDNIREQVAKELEKDIPIVKEKIRPILESFQKRWAEEAKQYQKRLLPLATAVQKQTKENMQAIYEKISPVAEEMKDKLRVEVDVLRSTLLPYSDDIRQKVVEKLEELKANANPKAEEYKAQLSQQIENLKQRFSPLAQSIREQLIPHAEQAKSRLTAMWEVVKARLGQSA
ncbi:hypothetical protein GDO86_012778 [Hymenochirus boettgeri]|uniref:Apolipoprotein A-I n=1 Tax=Hymenochirus boettgeri TaxID=247094 RepID=A0A8T2IU27_9PIPI|nr:hypothetical protein GDO86_012778 [Hymenochirus boettgeri]